MAGRKKPKDPERRRPLPGRPIQTPSPRATWTGPGPCPRPPELSTPGGRRGELAARSERLKMIVELDDIIANDRDHADREPERGLRRWALDRFLQAEEDDPSPRYARPQAAAPAPPPGWDDEL